MIYKKFCEIISQGEKRNIDFKIKLDVFSEKSVALRGELAKDICAMANNGNILSYIIVGVSDDGKQFRSNTNSQLTDDNLQDFCKNSIFPPPKVSLELIGWKKCKDIHKEKTFAILKIGPNRKQAYRLSRDFVNYGERVCYRKNEVWIRRNSVSDLATPEEIIQLASPSPQQVDVTDEVRSSRKKFGDVSIKEKQDLLDQQLPEYLRKMRFKKLQKQLCGRFSYSIKFPLRIYWKTDLSTLILILTFECREKFLNSDLQILQNFHRITDFVFIPSSIIPKIMTNEGGIEKVRVIQMLPILNKVPKNRIHTYLPEWNVSKRNYYHLYIPKFGIHLLRRRIPQDGLPTSKEIVIFDDIKSSLDFKQQVEDFGKSYLEMQKAIISINDLLPS
jgi:hypothetical protein